ncbi:hypothetical protein DACRYDRAFT_119943 [Dacryopinax primogenitus]|uniref:F-box domain-containing protein n=1 Tax=Dacryopinax primogenitus (strain DJM 731) TaxID=1858805 RepID=M5FU35_DACPD|nr:uncharacterized protein DACRYDRAFT_119943 [Dacryopinax primogenitus]EJT96731.1 hypothetical protein DACRYDRAFT_119943 [Dacryopinax primogenitus]
MSSPESDWSTHSEFTPVFGERWKEAAPENEIRLRDAIEKTEKDIKELYDLLEKQKEELFVARARQAPIARVPDDVLGLVFEALAKHLNSTRNKATSSSGLSTADQLACAQVCSRWRRVAFDTSALWSPFVINRDTGMLALEFAAFLLARTSWPFGLEFTLTCDKIGDLFKRSAAMLSRYGSRLTFLSLKVCKYGIHKFFAAGIGAHIPNLQYLKYGPEPKELCQP